jgi:general secretion pathway protein G
MGWHTKNSRRGFTLLELVVVLVILGTLAALVGPRLVGHSSEARITAAKTQIELFRQALETFRMHVGRYPTTQEKLDALQIAPPETPNWRGPYLSRGVPVDPWGRAYIYKAPGDQNREYEIVSLGSDGQIGGVGEAADVVSW